MNLFDEDVESAVAEVRANKEAQRKAEEDPEGKRIPVTGGPAEKAGAIFDSDIRQAVHQYRTQDTTEYLPPETWFGEASSGFSRGVDQMQSAGAGVLAIGADTVGLEGVRDSMLKVVEEQDRQIAERPSGASSYKDVHNFDSFMRYVFSGAGELAPNIIESFASGAAGAAIGGPVGGALGLVERQAAINVVKGGVKELADSAASKAVRSELAEFARGRIVKSELQDATLKILGKETARIGSKYGAIGALGASAITQETGSIYTDLLKDPSLDESDRKVSALVGGLIAGSMEGLFEGWIASKFFKGVKTPNKSELEDARGYLVKFVKNYGKEALEAMPGESGTEFLQAFTEEAAKNWADPKKRDKIFDFNEEQRASFLDAAFKGAIGGGMMAGGTAGFHALREASPEVEERQSRILKEADEQTIPVDDIIPSDEDVELSSIQKRMGEISQELSDPEITEETKLKLNEENEALSKRESIILGDTKEESEPLVNETPSVIDKELISKDEFRDDKGQLDASKATGFAASIIESALNDDRDVVIVADNGKKRVAVKRLDGNMMIGEDGNPWGIAPILFGDMSVEISEKKKQQSKEEPLDVKDVEVHGVDEIITNGGGQVKVTHKGKAVDFTDFVVAIDGNDAEVMKVKKGKQDELKGIGTLAYVKLGEQLAAKGITLRSSNAQYAAGRKLWDRLVKQGYAERVGSGDYRWKGKNSQNKAKQALTPAGKAIERLRAFKDHLKDDRKATSKLRQVTEEEFAEKKGEVDDFLNQIEDEEYREGLREHLADDVINMMAAEGVRLETRDAFQADIDGETIVFGIQDKESFDAAAKAIMHVSKGVEPTGKQAAAAKSGEVKNLATVIMHEIAHISYLVGVRRDWRADKQGLEFWQYEEQRTEELGRAAVEASEEIPWLLTKVYEPWEGGKRATFRKIGQEIPRMIIEAATTGKLSEMTSAIHLAAQENEATNGGPISKFLSKWVDAISKIHETLKQFMNPETAPPALLKAYDQTRQVMEEYGILVNETQEVEVIKEPKPFTPNKAKGTTESASPAKASKPGKKKQLVGGNWGRAVEMLGASMYSKNIGKTIAKEVFQNSVDAVMKTKGEKLIAHGTQKDKDSGVTYKVFEDNGPGMDVDDVLDKFLPAFTSGKDVGEGGGYGLAKLAFLGSSEEWEVITVSEKGGKKTKITITGTGKGYLEYVTNPPEIEIEENKDIKISSGVTMRIEENVSSRTGTALRFKMDPNDAYDGDSFLRQAQEYVTGVGYKYVFDKHNWRDNDKAKTPVQFWDYSSDADRSVEGKPMGVLHSVSLPEADVEIIAPDGAKMESRQYFSVPVLNRSILQFSSTFQTKDKILVPEGVAINIKPKVQAGTVGYPFATNRESITTEVSDAALAYFKESGERAMKEMLDSYSNALTSSPQIAGTTSVFLDLTKTLPDEVSKDIVNDPLTKDINDDISDIQNSVLKMLERKYKGKGFGRASFAGLMTGGNAYGVHFGKKDGPSQIYHDPWLTIDLAMEEAEDKSDHLDIYDRFLEKVAGIALHEALHQTIHSEGQELARGLTFKAGDLVDALMSFIDTKHSPEKIKQLVEYLNEKSKTLESFRSQEKASSFTASQAYSGYSMARGSEVSGRPNEDSGAASEVNSLVNEIDNIRPAIKVNGEEIVGNKGDTHQDILNRYIKENPEMAVDALMNFDTKQNPNYFKSGDQEISRDKLKKDYGIRDSQGLAGKQAAAARMARPTAVDKLIGNAKTVSEVWENTPDFAKIAVQQIYDQAASATPEQVEALRNQIADSKPVRGEILAERMEEETFKLYIGNDTSDLTELDKWMMENVMGVEHLPISQARKEFQGPVADFTGDLLIVDPIEVVSEASAIPAVNINEKLGEAKASKSIPKSLSLVEMGMETVNQETIDKLDEEFGYGNWIIKSFNPNAAKRKDVFTSQALRRLIARIPEAFAEYDTKELFAQELHDVTDETRASHEKNIPMVAGNDARIHIITDIATGRVDVVPFASSIYGQAIAHSEKIGVIFQNEDMALAESIAKEAIESLPIEDRSGSMFGVDLVRTKTGWGVVELNPTIPSYANDGEAGGLSGYIGDNVFVQEAIIAAMKGVPSFQAELALRLNSFVNERPAPAKMSKPEIRKIIAEAGDTQRGEPEHEMMVATMALQKLGAPAVLVHELEHIGDLADRASRENALINVKEKVRSALKYGTPGRWTWEEEIENGWRDQLAYKMTQSDPELRELYDSGNEGRRDAMRAALNSPELPKMIEEAKKAAKPILDKYAKSHIQFNKPVTTLGRLGREAAIALGFQQWGRWKVALYDIDDWLKEYAALKEDSNAQFEKFSEGFSQPAPAKMARPTLPSRDQKIMDQAFRETERAAVSTYGKINPKESEVKEVAGQVPIEGMTPQEMLYSTRTHTGSVLRAHQIINERGALNVAETLASDPFGEKLDILEDQSDKAGPNAVLGALYQMVAERLAAAAQRMKDSGGSIKARAYLIDTASMLDRRRRRITNVAGGMAAITGQVHNIANGETAKSEYLEPFMQAAEKILGSKTSEKFVELANELNKLWTKYSGNVTKSPRVISLLRRLHARVKSQKFAKGYRDTIIKSLQKLKAVTKGAAAKMADYIANKELDPERIRRSVDSIVMEMSGIPKEEASRTELEVAISTARRVIKTTAQSMNLIAPDVKIDKMTMEEQFAIILKNTELYDEYVRQFKQTYMREYGGRNPTPEFMAETNQLFGRIESRAWESGMVKTLVNEKMKAANLKMSEIVRDNYSRGRYEIDKLKDDFAAYLESEGIDDPQLLETLLNDVEREMSGRIEAARERFFGSTTTIKAFLKKLQTSLSDAATNYAVHPEHMAGSFEQMLVDEFDIPNTPEFPVARELASVMQSELNKLVEEESKRIIQRHLDSIGKDKPEKTKRKINRALERVLKLMKLGVMKKEDVYRSLQEVIPELPQYRQEVVEKLQALGDQLGQSDTELQRQIIQQQIASVLAQAKPFKTRDAYISWMYFSMLSGISTSLVNIGGNLTNLMAYFALEAAKHPTRAMKMLRSVVRAATGSAQVSMREAFWTGLNLDTAQEKYTMSGSVAEAPFATFESGYKNPAIKKIDESMARFTYKLLRGVKGQYVGRALMATDIFFRKIAQEMAYTARVGDQAIGTPEMWESALTRARIEMNAIGQNPDIGKDMKRRHLLLAHDIYNNLRLHEKGVLVNERETAWNESNVDSLDVTFTQEPKYLLGSLSKYIERFTNDKPIGKLIIPFTRVAANVANTMLEWTPFGFARYGLLALESGQNPFKLMEEGKWKKDSDIALRAAIGTMLIMTLIASAGEDDDDIVIYGGGPRDINARRQLQSMGWKPNSIKIGGTYYSYLYTPLAIALAIVGRQMDDYRDGRIADPHSISLASTGVALLDAVKNQSFLASVSDLMAAVDSPNPEDRLSRVFARMATIPVPNILKQIDKTVDPSVQEAEGFIETMIRDLPIARRALKPALNRFGEPIERTYGVFRFPGLERFATMEKTDDPVLNLISEKRIKIPGISKSTRINGHPIGDSFYEYTKEVGSALKSRIKDKLKELQEMSPEDAEDAILDMDKEEKKKARDKLKAKFPKVESLNKS